MDKVHHDHMTLMVKKTKQQIIKSVICKNVSHTCKSLLTLKAPTTTAADGIYKYFFNVFLEKIRLDVSSSLLGRGFT